MSKRTVALLLPSPSTLGPWGDPGWRPIGQIHYVAKGPDFLWGGSVTIGDGHAGALSPFEGMEVRDSPSDCAADIAVMMLGMLDVDGWRDLEAWWADLDARTKLSPVLDRLCKANSGQYKVGVVRFTDNVEEVSRLEQIADELADLGFGCAFFDEIR